MRDEIVFLPPRRFGMVLQVVAVILFFSGGLIGLWITAQADIGPRFLFYLLPSLIALGLSLFFLYRAYTLKNAYYAFTRDGLYLRWGLRIEDIPMNHILWVHPADKMESPIPYPLIRWPGAIIGTRRLPDRKQLEFLASDNGNLILINTRDRAFAISPSRSEDFLLVFQRLSEMGSISPITAKSVYPAYLLKQVWRITTARLLLLSGIFLSLILLVIVSWLIPSRQQVNMGALPSRAIDNIVPSVRLFLLPLLNSLIFFSNFIIGLYFFRQDENQILSYLLWLSGAVTPLLFLISVFFIFQR